MSHSVICGNLWEKAMRHRTVAPMLLPVAAHRSGRMMIRPYMQTPPNFRAARRPVPIVLFQARWRAAGACATAPLKIRSCSGFEGDVEALGLKLLDMVGGGGFRFAAVKVVGAEVGVTAVGVLQ